MPTVLIADKLAKQSVDVLRQAGLEVINRPGLTPEQLKEAVRGVEGAIVRSGAKFTADVLAEAGELKAVCRAGVGVDNIDVAAASRQGVVVMNTPGANTISTAEHTIALMLALSRNVGPAYLSMREGRWDRKKFMGAELAATTLGVVGLGRVGRAVAARAAAFDMKIAAYDPYISREAAAKLGIKVHDSLDELLKTCDYLTVHVPGGDPTRGMIGEAQIALMKPTARLVNCARGDVVDRDAVVAAVSEGRLAGAAFDVYSHEPPGDFEFARHDAILATPHLGASTEAAQIAVGIQAAEQMADALLRGHYRNAINVTSVPPEEMGVLRPYCELAYRMGQVIGTLNRGRLRSLKVMCTGVLAEHNATPVADHGVLGVLQAVLGDTVSIVSAPHLARERGLHVTCTTSVDQKDGFTDLVSLTLSTDASDLEVAGTVFGPEHIRMVKVGPFRTEVVPEGHLLLAFGQDKPGLIGSIGDTLFAAGVNIARMTFGRTEPGGDCLLALNMDSSCEEGTLEAIRALPAVDRAVRVALR